MCKNILIIRLSSIGDVIHCTPVASSLKATWPDCNITWLVSELAADLIKYNPHIDEVIIWSREKFEKHLREFKLKEAWRMWSDLKEQVEGKYFDIVLDIHGLFLTGMIASQVKTGRRIGMRGAKELNSLFMNETGKPVGEHIIHKYLGVLTCLGIEKLDTRMHLIVPPEARQFAQNFFKEHVGVQTGKIAIVVLGTTWPSKNWPALFFEKLVLLLVKDFTIVLCGGRQEMAMGKEIETRTGVGVINTIGQTGLLDMAALMEKAVVVIAGDTGPLHMAGALGVPTVGIFGPTNPAIYAPQGEGNVSLVSNLSCSYCHKQRCPQGKEAECMKEITPEAVLHKVYEVYRKD